ncbi:tetratricopeptide repeat protein [Tahibacter caeni]|uniref:tetratricopeptide repeat protein n=1 Tax=Tahibacter caeni TaxID=1453545 RepID=UPI0021498F29|nr:tetratricopeptide repeat protein [Tahibacter caeni]
MPPRHYRAVLLLLAALLLGWWAYMPGLGGGFLFDDYINLTALGTYGRVDDAPTFWRYITSGSADTTGRPVALLSFLLDAQNWPADPYPFKRTNVLLHLGNAVLLAVFLTQLGRRLRGADMQGRAAADTAAVLAAALWLLHPLMVSTTLYVVQREAMLPATFMLIGLIGFVHARTKLAHGAAHALTEATAWIGAMTVLATLSKGNGALLPLLAWLVERILLARAEPLAPAQALRWRRWQWIVLGLPTLAVLLWLGANAYTGLSHGLPYRSWTLGERLLTQNRVLLDYLQQLWLPHPYSVGLFNDSLRISRGWLDPASTLFSALVLLALLVGAWLLRRRQPTWALAVLFFFAGHLIESTVVPLEMYFEHRNYVPTLPMFWPLALWLCSPAVSVRFVRRLLAVVLPLGLTMLTRLGAAPWGNVEDQGLLWAYRNPDSARAQANAAQIEIARGDPAAAARRLQRALQRQPDDLQLSLNLIGARCRLGGVGAEDLDRAERSLREARDVGRMGFEWFEPSLAFAASGACPGLDLSVMERLLAAAESNPRGMASAGRRQDLHYLRARIALIRRDGDLALTEFNAALDAKPGPHAAMAQAAELGQNGFPAQGLRHLDRADALMKSPDWIWNGYSMVTVHNWLLVKQGYWCNELDHLRGVLQSDLDAAAPEAKP